MSTSPPITANSVDNPLVNQEFHEGEQVNGSSPPVVVQTVERVITPIQPPLQSASSLRSQTTIGLSAPSAATFPVLRATTFQLALGHPLAYVRALMQMGYEPLPAYRAKNLFGKEVVYYPNVFRYLKYVYNTDGFLGLYRGFGYSLLSKVVCWYTTTKVDELLGPKDTRGDNDQERPTWNRFMQQTLREVQCQSWGILISHPFQVMAIRCMAQFVGREKLYSSLNIFQNCREIYQQQGLGGFFVGLIPRWLLEVSTILLTNMIVHLLKTQLSLQKEVTPVYKYVAAMVAQSITYPLSVVTTVTAINRSGLRAASLPLAPIYANWQDAYKYLSQTEQLKRGSSLFNRAVLGTSGIPTPGTPIPNA